MSDNPPGSARDQLRKATAKEHALVDEAFGAFALDRREDYVSFLRAQAGAYVPTEAALDHAGAQRLIPDWPHRRRAALLREDLKELAASAIDYQPILPIVNPAAVFGAAYVLEGSRLGGRLLARSVPEQFPRRFIDGGDRNLWRVFLATMERALTTQAEIDEAITAARTVFATFEASARLELKGRG